MRFEGTMFEITFLLGTTFDYLARLRIAKKVPNSSNEFLSDLEIKSTAKRG